MYIEVPKCLKCCFCLPLRYSLAVWGYFKLITSLISLVVLFYALAVIPPHPYVVDDAVIALSILITVVSVDTIFDFVLIVAAHKKHVTLFKCYYYYSLFILVLLIVDLVLTTGYHAVLFNNELYPPIFVSKILIRNFFVVLGIILIQVYIILLVRTEMTKLRDNCKFEFVNNAAESQCTVNIGTDHHIGLKDDALNEDIRGSTLRLV